MGNVSRGLQLTQSSQVGLPAAQLYTSTETLTHGVAISIWYRRVALFFLTLSTFFSRLRGCNTRRGAHTCLSPVSILFRFSRGCLSPPRQRLQSGSAHSFLRSNVFSPLLCSDRTLLVYQLLDGIVPQSTVL